MDTIILNLQKYNLEKEDTISKLSAQIIEKDEYIKKRELSMTNILKDDTDVIRSNYNRIQSLERIAYPRWSITSSNMLRMINRYIKFDSIQIESVDELRKCLRNKTEYRDNYSKSGKHGYNGLIIHSDRTGWILTRSGDSRPNFELNRDDTYLLDKI